MEMLRELKEDALYACMDAFDTAVWAVQQEVRAYKGLALVEGVRMETRREIKVMNRRVRGVGGRERAVKVEGGDEAAV